MNAEVVAVYCHLKPSSGFGNIPMIAWGDIEPSNEG
jgi:hypothetical protein